MGRRPCPTSRMRRSPPALDSRRSGSSRQTTSAQRGTARSVRTGVLLVKDRHRDEEVAADYAGFVIADEFVVGYGLDFKGRYRNLPYVGVLTPEAIARGL